MNQYLKAMRNGFNFHGRATRREFWLFGLILFLLSIVTTTLDVAFGFADEGALVLTGIVSLVHIIPQLAVSVRRLHDIDKSGWWLLIAVTGIGAIILLVFACLASTRGPNHYGPAPDGSVGDGAQSGPYGAVGGQGLAHGQTARQAASASLQAAQTSTVDPLAQLEKLKALHDGGALDDAEFAKMKADLLSKVG